MADIEMPTRGVRRDVGSKSNAEVSAADVARFLSSLRQEDLAKLACFLHLTNADHSATVDLRIGQKGQVVLTIKAVGCGDEGEA